jgi:hypothetical protein
VQVVGPSLTRKKDEVRILDLIDEQERQQCGSYPLL